MSEMSDMLIPLIADGKAGKYNPICVYGSQYLVGRFCEEVHFACLETDPHRTVCRLSADEYLEQIISGIVGGYSNLFTQRIRRADMLIFTDIDKMQGSEASMEEFYFLFNHFYIRDKMIVIGSSVPYTELSGLKDRVLAQLSGGLIVGLEDGKYKTPRPNFLWY